MFEVKYGGEIKGKQLELFNTLKAKEFHLITGQNDLIRAGLQN